MSQVAKKKATAAEKDISHFSFPVGLVQGATAVLLTSGVCSSLLKDTDSCRKRKIIQETGRELEIIGSENGHEGEQAVIDALNGREVR